MKYGVIGLLVLTLALPAMAWLTQPVAEVSPVQGGLMRVTGAVVLESDVNAYLGRFSYAIMDDLSAFVGVGLIDPSGASSEPGVQFGGLYRLPVEIPVEIPIDIGVRAAGGYVDTDIWDLFTLNAGALVSAEVIEKLSVYSQIGVSWQKASGTVTIPAAAINGWVIGGRRTSWSETNTELSLTAGALYALDDHISFFGEVSYIDEVFFGLGARYTF